MHKKECSHQVSGKYCFPLNQTCKSPSEILGPWYSIRRQIEKILSDDQQDGQKAATCDMGRGWKNWSCLAWRKERTSSINLPLPKGRVEVRQSLTLLRAEQQKSMRQQSEFISRKSLTGYKGKIVLPNQSNQILEHSLILHLVLTEKAFGLDDLQRPVPTQMCYSISVFCGCTEVLPSLSCHKV